MLDEEMESTPEMIKAEIEEMIKNHPYLAVQCITELADYICVNVYREIIGNMYEVFTERV